MVTHRPPRAGQVEGDPVILASILSGVIWWPSDVSWPVPEMVRGAYH